MWSRCFALLCVPALLAAAPTETLPRALTPAESRAALRPKPELAVELAAAEPLVVDPVAIDWGTDGRLWVVEMRDYPMGMDGKWKPGGVIKVLTDIDGDGRYDTARVFMSDVPFPTGVMPWKKGALICSAPDILYAEDTDGDGRADLVKTILTGFPTDNYQARLNSLSLGLDNWIYAANTMRGNAVHGLDRALRPVEVHGHDIRFQPDTGVVESAAGRSQFGRVRDDWDNWFGCHNTNPLLHFPLREEYARRNPHVATPPATVYLPNDLRQNRVFPRAQPLERFNSPDQRNYITSGCGLGIYRDTLLGPDFSGNAFVCEPVHSLVTRLQIVPHGATFDAHRAPDEATSEFLASTSIWFTPVQSRPGPDGALWVVDMVRPIIEHPRWIPPERLARLDVRAGDEQGRIFRVVRKGVPPRPVRDLTKLSLPELVAALETPNGSARDLVHLELLFRGDVDAVPRLAAIARTSAMPEARGQALAILDGLGRLAVEQVRVALSDLHAGVRRFALRLAERFLGAPSPLDERLEALAADPDPAVRFQLALSLAGWHRTHQAARLLGRIAVSEPSDPWLRAAVVSSALREPVEILDAVLAAGGIESATLAADLVTTAVATAPSLEPILRAVAPPEKSGDAGWRFIVLAGLQNALDRRHVDLATFPCGDGHELAAALGRIRQAYTQAAAVARDATQPVSIRQAALQLLGRGFNDFEHDLPVLVSFLEQTGEGALTASAVDIIRRSRSPRVPELLLGHWSRFTPALRASVMEILVSRDDWAAQLLTVIEQGSIPALAVPVAIRQRLMHHGEAALRTRATKLFAGGSSPDRRAVVARYRAVRALTGDSQRGAEVFASICATCHVFVGECVGPTLAMFRKKTVDDFLEAILDPNAAVEPRFTAYSIVTKDGRSLSGVISSESATSLHLMLPGNLSQQVLRSDIASMTALDRSLMPEGLENAIAPQAMADLIAYVTASKETAGSAPAH